MLSLIAEYPMLLRCGATRTELRLYGTAFSKHIAKKPIEKVFWKSGEEMLDDQEAKNWLRQNQTSGGRRDDTVDVEKEELAAIDALREALSLVSGATWLMFQSATEDPMVQAVKQFGNLSILEK